MRTIEEIKKAIEYEKENMENSILEDDEYEQSKGFVEALVWVLGGKK